MTRIDLDKLAQPAPAPRRVTLDVGSLVAPHNVAPQKWQAVSARPTGSWKPPVRDSPDLQRILALPRRPVPTADSVTGRAMVALAHERYRLPARPCRCEAIQREFGVGKLRGCITELKFEQAWGLYELSTVGGLLGSVGVGYGKTIFIILAALALPGAQKVVALVQPKDVLQYILTYQLLREHFRVPSIIVENRTNFTRTAEGEPRLHVMPYSTLSRPESSAALSRMAPDAILADECDKLRDLSSATTTRYMRIFQERPDTRGAALTGSMTDGTIEDFGHLGLVTLRNGSPVPVDPETLKEWGTAINPVPIQAPMGALAKLCQPGEPLREAFRRRIAETPGVITTRTPAVSCAMVITERKAPPIPEVIREALIGVREFRRPDGDELVEEIEKQECARQVASGFYYRWRFPPIHGVPQRRENIDLWYEVRRDYNRSVRLQIQAGLEHLDSPALCEAAARRHWGDPLPKRAPKEGPTWASIHWPAWRDIRETVVAVPEAVRLDDYLARDAAEWALSHRGIVWYDAREFGLWIAELSKLTLHTGGPKAPELIMRDPGDRSIIVSMNAHARGTDGLQRSYDAQLFTDIPANATGWEQRLGRLARHGQASPTVTTWFYRHTLEFRQALAKALRRAEYVEQTWGVEQKLLSGIDPALYDDSE